MAAPKGYSEPTGGASRSKGYTPCGELTFDDMFDAFETPNRGTVGGDRTVDDFTPEGLSDK